MRDPLRSSWIIAAAAALMVAAPGMPASSQDKSDQGTIQITYETPKDKSVQEAYDMAKGARSLEMMQVIFSPFRLPEDLYMKYVNCDGVPNAYFFREDDKPVIRVSYEYLRSIYDMMPKETTAEGITPREAFTGQLLFAIAHEFGHAAFDIYNVPVLGRQEDAADQFASHFLLNFGGELAKRLIWGAVTGSPRGACCCAPALRCSIRRMRREGSESCARRACSSKPAEGLSRWRAVSARSRPPACSPAMPLRRTTCTPMLSRSIAISAKQ